MPQSPSHCFKCDFLLRTHLSWHVFVWVRGGIAQEKHFISLSAKCGLMIVRDFFRCKQVTKKREISVRTWRFFRREIPNTVLSERLAVTFFSLWTGKKIAQALCVSVPKKIFHFSTGFTRTSKACHCHTTIVARRNLISLGQSSGTASSSSFFLVLGRYVTKQCMGSSAEMSICQKLFLRCCCRHSVEKLFEAFLLLPLLVRTCQSK